MKFLTRSEAETKRQKAVDFLHRIGNDDLADEFEDMSPEEYAERKGAQLLENPKRSKSMARRRKTVDELEAELSDLQEQVSDLEEENDALQSRLDDITNIASGEDEEDEEAEEGEDDGYSE